MLLRVGPLEITVFHVAFLVALLLVYLLSLLLLKCISMGFGFDVHHVPIQSVACSVLFQKKTPTVFRNIERIAGLHSIRHSNYTLHCGAESNAFPGSGYNNDRQSVETALRTLLNNPRIVVPETTVAVSIPTSFSTCGPRFHQFECRPPAPEWTSSTITRDNHYRYKMVAGQIQATFHNDRRCHYLAGICVYLRVPHVTPWFFRGVSTALLIHLLRGNVQKRAEVPSALSRRGRPLTSSFNDDINDDDDDDSSSSDSEYITVTPSPSPSPSPPPYSIVVVENNEPPPAYFSLFSPDFL